MFQFLLLVFGLLYEVVLELHSRQKYKKSAKHGCQFLLRMTSAPMTPGTHPAQVRMKTMSTDPHPRSMTASGGKKMARRTRINDMRVDFKISGKGTKRTLYYQPSGRTILSTPCASANSGAISSSVNPAMPQPMRVTRKVSSGCSFAKAINSST